MKTKTLWVLAAALAICFLVGMRIIYQAGYRAGQNVAEYRMREKEVAFKREKETQRKIEFAKSLRVDEERWNQLQKEARQARERDYLDAMEKSSEKQQRLIMEALRNITGSSPLISPFSSPPPSDLQNKCFLDPKDIRKPKKELEQARLATKTNPQTQPVTSQWRVFETATIDGWVKKIKRGTIFKTTSGNIYEVVGVVILLEMELRPKVTVLTDGQLYKLLIQGVDEELLCKKLNLGNESTSSGDAVIETRITSGFDGLEYGNIYKLDNGQVWEQTGVYIYVYVSVMPKVTIWRDGSVHKMKVQGIDEAVTVQQLK